MNVAVATSPLPQAGALTPAPVIETARLALRGPGLAEFDAFAAFHADPARCLGFGPVMDRPKTWRWWAANIGHWHIHGYGYFTIWDRQSGRPAGICGIWNPEGWPEPEVGWVVFEAFEGRGIAYEAALAARGWAYDTLGMTTLTSNIKPGNTRSQALATRLGAHHERSYDNPEMGDEELWRHPGPAEAQR
ncbi:GNAT family N-acetyltransferase [Roseivivax halodurans]|uniref:GNAT family N-acetyltransferase n=1 Tax=Roseivivax halodurans TaxID=93683 RepID=UPI0004B1187B|nr:GNAT family N-acetyltransferase [Roseivivax halodurans]